MIPSTKIPRSSDITHRNTASLDQILARKYSIYHPKFSTNYEEKIDTIISDIGHFNYTIFYPNDYIIVLSPELLISYYSFCCQKIKSEVKKVTHTQKGEKETMVESFTLTQGISFLPHQTGTQITIRKLQREDKRKGKSKKKKKRTSNM